MPAKAPVLHLLCGKIASGKSTMAAVLAAADNTVLISEDLWLDALYGDQMQSAEDYLRYSSRLRAIMAPHVAALLGAGTSVVLDFPSNTRNQRDWMRKLVAGAGVDHQMHLLDASDDLCLKRLAERNASGSHPFVVTEEMFQQFTRHFTTPADDEGFRVLRHPQTG